MLCRRRVTLAEKIDKGRKLYYVCWWWHHYKDTLSALLTLVWEIHWLLMDSFQEATNTNMTTKKTQTLGFFCCCCHVCTNCWINNLGCRWFETPKHSCGVIVIPQTEVVLLPWGQGVGPGSQVLPFWTATWKKTNKGHIIEHGFPLGHLLLYVSLYSYCWT